MAPEAYYYIIMMVAGYVSAGVYVHTCLMI